MSNFDCKDYEEVCIAEQTKYCIDCEETTTHQIIQQGKATFCRQCGKSYSK